MAGMVFTVTADTVEELKQKVIAAAKMFGAEVHDSQMSLPLPEKTKSSSHDIPAAPAASTAEQPAPTKKRGRPAKSHSEKEVEAKSEESEVKTDTSADPFEDMGDDVAAKPVTKEDALSALKAVHTTKGAEIARSVLNTLKYEKWSDVKSEHYPALVEACNQALSA